MSDYQRIADDVRNFIEATDQTRESSLDALAEAYATACREVNARLRRCADLLHKGLRSEALNYAKQAPDLLDSVAALDIPGIEAWEETCALYGLARPVRMQLDLAAEVNDAYSAEAPLESTLDELRLLVMARASAFARLRVMRRLRALDTASSHWEEDVVALEQACLAGLRQDVNAALKSGDVSIVQRLLADLTSADWIVKPSRELLDPVIAFEVDTQVQFLASAQATSDVNGARRAMQSLQKCLARHSVKLPAKHAPAFASATAWLGVQDQLQKQAAAFEELCAQLEADVQSDVPLHQLESLWVRIAAYGLPVPQRVRETYEQATRGKRIIANRARARNLALVVGAIALAGAGVWLLIDYQRSSAAAKLWISRVEQALTQYDFKGAATTWETLSRESPDLLNRHDLQTARKRLEEATKNEADRVTRFEKAMAEVESSTASPKVKLAQLAEAALHVRLDTEKLKVRTLKREYEAQIPPAKTPEVAEATPTATSGSELAPTPSRQASASPSITLPQTEPAPAPSNPTNATALPTVADKDSEVSNQSVAATTAVPADRAWVLPLEGLNDRTKSVAFICDTPAGLVGSPAGKRLISELLGAINKLSASQNFTIALAGEEGSSPSMLGNVQMLIAATEANKRKAQDLLTAYPAAQRPDIEGGLRAALRLKPEQVFLLIDGAAPPQWKVEDLQEAARVLNVGKLVKIHVVMIGRQPETDVKGLSMFAAENSGRFVHVDDDERVSTAALPEATNNPASDGNEARTSPARPPMKIPASLLQLVSMRFAEVSTDSDFEWTPLADGERLYAPARGFDAERNWGKIPPPLVNGTFTRFPMTNDVSKGRTDFSVLSDGVVLLALHGPGGGSGGAWEAECVTPEQLEEQGWTKLSVNLGERVLMAKYCSQGDTFRLRTQKYHMPILVRVEPKVPTKR